MLLAEAQAKANALRGEGEQAAITIFAEAFQRDPEFFQFYRTMQAWREAFSDGETRMLLSPDAEFFRYFRSIPMPGSAAGRSGGAADGGAAGGARDRARPPRSARPPRGAGLPGSRRRGGGGNILARPGVPRPRRSPVLRTGPIRSRIEVPAMRCFPTALVLLAASLPVVLRPRWRRPRRRRRADRAAARRRPPPRPPPGENAPQPVPMRDAPPSFAPLARQLLPAVVNISTSQAAPARANRPDAPDMPQAPPGSPFEEFFREFFRNRPGPGGPGPGPDPDPTSRSSAAAGSRSARASSSTPPASW